MKILRQLLEELEHLNIAIQKSNYYTEKEAHEEIIVVIKEWLQQKQKDEYKNWHKELNETLRIIYRSKNIMLNELLEELEEDE